MKQVAIPMEELVPLLQLQMEAAGYAQLTVTGYSMMPMLHNRKDTVELTPVEKPLRRGDLILYLRDNGAYVLHRILRVKGTQLICCGDNQCRRERIRADQVLAVTRAFTRNGKYHPVTDKAYRRYVAIWVGLHPLRWLYLGPRRMLGYIRTAIRRIKRSVAQGQRTIVRKWF